MDYAGAQIGTLVEFSALSAPLQGAIITSTAQIPEPVDYQFLGAARNAGPTARERWLMAELLRRDRRGR